MLKGIHPLLGPDVLDVMARAGHGDVLALVDRNYPAYQAGVPVVRVDGVDTTTLASAMLTVFPIDDFDPGPVSAMVPADGSRPSSHEAMEGLLRQAEGRDISLAPVQRHAFYDLARRTFAVITTSDDRPYSCFLITKGVV